MIFGKPLSKFFGKSLESGVLLSLFNRIWKRANVSILHRPGPKLFKTNYRAISLYYTFIPCKILEWSFIVKEVITMFFIANILMSANQPGFLPNRSCVKSDSKLDIITDSLEKRLSVDVIYSWFFNSLWLRFTIEATYKTKSLWYKWSFIKMDKKFPDWKRTKNRSWKFGLKLKLNLISEIFKIKPKLYADDFLLLSIDEYPNTSSRWFG